MIFSSMVKVSAKVGAKVIAYAPELMIAGGIISGGIATYKAINAGGTMAIAVEEYEKEKERMNDLKEVIDEDNVIITMDDGSIYGIEEWNKELHDIKVSTAMFIGKSLIPVVCFTALSVTMVLGGYKIIQTRASIAAAAAMTLDYNFRKYRERVIESEGEDADFCYRTGATMGKVEREVVDEKTGELKKKKVKEPVIGEEAKSVDYTVNYLREASWLSDYQDMQMILKDILMIQDSANMLLKHRWFMTWNEVRQMLHLKQTTAGQFVGWTMDPKSGDCIIDLRPRIVYDEFLAHDTIILDPNLDGLMVNRIDEIYQKRKDGIAL